MSADRNLCEEEARRSSDWAARLRLTTTGVFIYRWSGAGRADPSGPHQLFSPSSCAHKFVQISTRQNWTNSDTNLCRSFNGAMFQRQIYIFGIPTLLVNGDTSLAHYILQREV